MVTVSGFEAGGGISHTSFLSGAGDPGAAGDVDPCERSATLIGSSNSPAKDSNG